jgi:hypothetical protein
MASNRTIGAPVGGLILISLGTIFLLAQTMGFGFLGALWPLLIVGVGAIFFMAMFAGGRGAAPLAIPGSIVTTVGLILLFQSYTQLWNTWSYAWSLIIVAVGVGTYIKGLWGKDEKSRRVGMILAGFGALFCVVFGAFFGLGIGFYTWPIAPGIVFPLVMIGLGLFLVLKRTVFVQPLGSDRPWTDSAEHKPAER